MDTERNGFLFGGYIGLHMKTFVYISANSKFLWVSTLGCRTFDIINGIDIMSRNVFDYEKFFGSYISIQRKSCFSVGDGFKVKSKREYVRDMCYSKHVDCRILRTQYIRLGEMFRII